jgi:hypothetical protein
MAAPPPVLTHAATLSPHQEDSLALLVAGATSPPLTTSLISLRCLNLVTEAMVGGGSRRASGLSVACGCGCRFQLFLLICCPPLILCAPAARRALDITETDRRQLVLFGIQNGTFVPCLEFKLGHLFPVW